MSIFGSFFERRRRRESAVQPGDELTPEAPPTKEAEPVGRSFEDVGQPISVNMGAGPADIAGVLGMIGQAMRSGQVQVQHSENQVIDLRGSGLREEIVEAMRLSGVDPQANDGQIDAGQYGDLQRQILEALQRHGVDVARGGEAMPVPDADGDGRPG